MPELPEVETIRAGLERDLKGARIVRVQVLRPDVILGGEMPPDGATFSRFLRKGKQLAIECTGGRTIVVQLGMSGSLVLDPPSLAKHTHVAWHLELGRVARLLVFRDIRRFGGITCAPSVADVERTLWNTLGPDALDVSGAHLARALGRSRRIVKSALLDQRALAGVGNMYADEALFEARIAPQRLCRTLPNTAWDDLAHAVHAVLDRAIAAGGTTLRDYVDVSGASGKGASLLRVYGRKGQACGSCGTALQGAKLAQRSAVWCPVCQH